MNDVKQILTDHIKSNGFDGLFNSSVECGCSVDDMAPCCNNSSGILDCERAYKFECSKCIKQETCEVYDEDYTSMFSPDRRMCIPEYKTQYKCTKTFELCEWDDEAGNPEVEKLTGRLVTKDSLWSNGSEVSQMLEKWMYGIKALISDTDGFLTLITTDDGFLDAHFEPTEEK